MRALLASLLLLAASLSDAAVVILKDGSRFTGTVVGATAQDVRLHTEHGVMTIESSKIERVDYAESAVPPPPAPPPARLTTAAEELERREKHEHMISIGAGLAAPLSDIDFGGAGGAKASNGDVGVALGVHYLKLGDSPWALGGGVDLLSRGATLTNRPVPLADASVSGSSVLLTGQARYSLKRDGSVRPYLQAGLGAHHTNTYADAEPLPGFGWSDTNTTETRRIIDDSRWGLAATAAVGVEFLMMSPVSFSFEVGWAGLHDSGASPTAAGRALGLGNQNPTLHVLTVAGKWGWRF